MALVMPVLRPKQSERVAATLNSPPLTWMSHWVALRNGMMPGSRRCTRAPRDRKSRLPCAGMFRPYFILIQLRRLWGMRKGKQGKPQLDTPAVDTLNTDTRPKAEMPENSVDILTLRTGPHAYHPSQVFFHR